MPFGIYFSGLDLSLALPRSQIGAVPPAFSLHIFENCNLETEYQKSDASCEAAASASTATTACACPRPRGASALGACSQYLRTLRGCRTECQERARSDAHARTLPRTRSAPGRIPSSQNQADRCLC